jgi:hypothetical protein
MSRTGPRRARSIQVAFRAGDGGGTLESDDAERPAASHFRLVDRKVRIRVEEK